MKIIRDFFLKKTVCFFGGEIFYMFEKACFRNDIMFENVTLTIDHVQQ